MPGQSPTQLSLAWLRANGYVPWICEYWSPFPKPRGKRVDMYGMFDLIGVSEQGTVAIQTTSTGVAARVKKMTDDEHAEALAACRKAGWTIHVHGWTSKKIGNRRLYRQRIVDLS